MYTKRIFPVSMLVCALLLSINFTIISAVLVDTSTNSASDALRDIYQRKIARDTNGNIYMVYPKENGGLYQLYVAKSTNNGASWTTSAIPKSNANAPDHDPAMAIDSNNVLHVVFIGYQNYPYYSYSNNAASSWSSPVTIENTVVASYPSIAIDSNNNLHVAMIKSYGAPPSVAVNYYRAVSQAWSWISETPYPSTGNYYWPAIAVDKNNAVHIAWSHLYNGGTEILYAKYTTNLNSVTTIGNFASGFLVASSLIIDGNNNIFVFWNFGTINYNIFDSKTSTWAGAKQLGGIGHVSPAIDNFGRIYILYANPSGNMIKGSQFIYSENKWSTEKDIISMTKTYGILSSRWSTYNNPLTGSNSRLDVGYSYDIGSGSPAEINYDFIGISGQSLSISPSDASWLNVSSPNFSWSLLSDPSSSGLHQAGFQLQISSSNSMTPLVYNSNDKTSTSTQFTIPSTLSDGQYYWRVRQIDGNNFYSEWSGIKNLGIDVTPPTEWSSFQQVNSTDRLKPSLSIAVRDSSSGLSVSSAKYRISSNGGTTWSSWNAINCAGSDGDTISRTIGPQQISFTTSSITKNKIQFKITDIAGNIGISPINNVVIDDGPPNAPQNLTVTPSNWTNVNRFTISWDSPIDIGGISCYYLKIGALPTGSSKGTKILGTTSNIEAPNEGITKFYVSAEDKFGFYNVNNYAEGNLKFDSTPPQSPTQLTGPLSGFNTTPTQLSWTAPDDISGIVGYYYKFDAVPTSSNNPIYNSLNIINISVPEGNHTFYLIAKDAAGNIGYNNYASINLMADYTPPSKPSNLIAFPNGWTNSPTIKFSWDAINDLSGISAYYYKFGAPITISELENQANTKDTTISYTVKNDGEQTLYLFAKDNVGNYDASSQASVKFYIDRIAPDAPIGLISSPLDWTIQEKFTISWKNPTDVSGIKGAYYRSDVPPTSEKGGTFVNLNNMTSISITVTKAGINKIYVWLEDFAGNIDYKKYSSIQIKYLGGAGRPTITSNNPPNMAKDVPQSTPITISFSQPMEKTSVQNNFYISPSVSGGYTWDGSKMTFTPSEKLKSGTTYTYGIKKDAMNSDGIPMGTDFSYQFEVTKGNSINSAINNRLNLILIGVIVMICVLLIVGYALWKKKSIQKNIHVDKDGTYIDENKGQVNIDQKKTDIHDNRTIVTGPVDNSTNVEINQQSTVDDHSVKYEMIDNSKKVNISDSVILRSKIASDEKEIDRKEE